MKVTSSQERFPLPTQPKPSSYWTRQQRKRGAEGVPAGGQKCNLSVLPPSSSQQGALMQQLLFQNRHLFPAKGAAQTLTSQAQGPAIKCFNYRSMLPQGSAPAGSQKLHKQVSSTRLAVCSKPACVSVIAPTDSREGQTLILHMASPPLTLSYLIQKHGAQNVREGSRSKTSCGS